MNLSQQFKFSLRMLRREWRAGDVSTLALASFMAVVCLTTVLFFVDRLQQALLLQASELMAADLRYVSDQPISDDVLAQLPRSGLQRSSFISFRSMVLYQGKAKLVELKAVADAYPLRGGLKLTDFNRRFDSEHKAPAPGQVWVDKNMYQQLALQLGGQLTIGNANFEVAAVIDGEPDRAGDLFSIAPRVMIASSDLPRTGLIQAGSRIRYALLLAGDKPMLAKAKQLLQKQLKAGDHLETVTDTRGEVRVSMQHARQFFGLVAVISVILSITAIAVCARRFAERNSQTFAVFCCLGARRRDVIQAFTLQLTLIAIIAGILGSVVGWLLHNVLANMIGNMLLFKLPPASLWPALPGIVVAISASLLVASPPILRLRDLPVMQVLKMEHVRLRFSAAASYVLGLLLVFTLVYFLAQDTRMAFILCISLGATLALLAVATWLILHLLRRLPLRRLNAWTIGLRNVLRHPWQNLIQILAFGVSIMAVVLLTMLRNDLLSIWKEGLADDVPNRFIINIQADQKPAITDYLQQNGFKDARLYPLINGRITQVKGVDVADMVKNPRQKGLLEHGYRMSWQGELNDDIHIVSGQWWQEKDVGKPLVSLDKGMADTLNLQIGDTLTFDVGGTIIVAEIASTREVKWDSFKPNFYVLANPGLFDEHSTSYITSVYVATERESQLDNLISRFPNLTVINASDIIHHVRDISTKVSIAIEFMFILALISGAVLLLATIRVSYQQRKRETAIQRAIGASSRRIISAISAEFAFVGLLAGVIAMFFSTLTASVMAQEIFQRTYLPSPWYWVISLLSATLLVALLGLLSLRPILKVSPMQSLKS